MEIMFASQLLLQPFPQSDKNFQALLLATELGQGQKQVREQ